MRVFALLAALMLGVSACADGGEPATASGTADSSIATTQPSTSATPTTSSTTTTTSETDTTTTTTTATGGNAAQPFDTWITVLASLPTNEYDATQAAELAAATHSKAAVLLSDDYASLNPGFWVVYVGGHDFAWEAEAACPEAVDDCYARYLAALADDAEVGAAADTALVALLSGELVAIAASTGETLRTFDHIGGDGAYPGSLTLAADGRAVYYTVGFEDFWFSCDASDGTLMHFDLASSRPEQIGDGFSPQVSSDGRHLLYLASSQCFEDPNEPQFVLAPIDTVVRRDLATGEEARLTVDLEGDTAAGYELWSAAWGPHGEVYVLDTDGTLWLFTGAGDGGWVTDHRRLAEIGTGVDASLIGWDDERSLVLYSYPEWRDDAVTSFLGGFDPVANAIVDLVEVEGPAAFALDAGGDRVLAVARQTVDGVDRSVALDADVSLVEW